MDATLSDEQHMLAEMAASIAGELAATSSTEIGAVDLEAGRRLLADVGLLSLRLPVDVGGGAASAVEVAIVAEEFGRRLCPLPFAGPIIASELLSLAQVDSDVLASVGAGRRPLTVAVDRGLGDLARWPATGAIIAWDSAGAEQATGLMAPSSGDRCGRWEPAVVGATGPVVPSVDLTRRLVALEPSETPQALGGGLDGAALQRWLAFALSVLCADMVGVMAGGLAMAVAYASERVQFGRRIGTFQSIQHLCAEQLVSVEAARSATYHAAWAVDGLPAAEALLAARIAKAYVSREAPLVAEAVIQVHGGIGHTWESLAHVFLRRALLDRALLGDQSVHLSAIAAHLEGG
jgi:alkylation response protein AidB-like acyl-CoA dehydrogenase